MTGVFQGIAGRPALSARRSASSLRSRQGLRDLALTDGVSYGNIPWIGAGLVALGLAFSLLSHLLDRRAPSQRA
jgi:hypothetical protein